MKKVTFALSALTVAVAGVALAQAPANGPANPGAMPPHTQFSSLDTNKDGRISKDEIKSNAELTSSFSNLDTDHDSYLSESEYGKWKAMPDAKSGSKEPKSNY